MWHGRFMHINQKLSLIAKPDLKNWPDKHFCDGCVAGKFHRHSHSGKRPLPADMAWAVGEYVTCDLFGPLLRSMGGGRYVAFYVDVKSRFIYAKILRDKVEHYLTTPEVFRDIKARSGNAALLQNGW